MNTVSCKDLARGGALIAKLHGQGKQEPSRVDGEAWDTLCATHRGEADAKMKGAIGRAPMCRNERTDRDWLGERTSGSQWR